MKIIPFASITEGASKINNIQQYCRRLNQSGTAEPASDRTGHAAGNGSHAYPEPAGHGWEPKKRHMPCDSAYDVDVRHRDWIRPVSASLLTTLWTTTFPDRSKKAAAAPGSRYAASHGRT